MWVKLQLRKYLHLVAQWTNQVAVAIWHLLRTDTKTHRRATRYFHLTQTVISMICSSEEITCRLHEGKILC